MSNAKAEQLKKYIAFKMTQHSRTNDLIITDKNQMREYFKPFLAQWVAEFIESETKR